MDVDTDGARVAVLARLWGAYGREPLDGVRARRTDGNDLALTLVDDRIARGSSAAAAAFARPDADFAIDVDGQRITDPAALLRVISPDTPARERFAAELDNSVANLALARAVAGPDEPIRLADLSRVPASTALAYLEQSIVDGHPLHPLCRSRTGMCEADIRRYAPEFRPVVALSVIDVPPDRWFSTGAGLPPELPMHPWQADRVLGAHPELRSSGRTIRARPLMSLRTLALIDEPRWHLKTAVDVQMTSAVRTVSPAAIHNGPTVSVLLRHLTRFEAIDVLAETAGGAVLVDGEPSRSLAVIRRRAPRLSPGEIAVPLAVLSARSPATGRAFLLEAAGDDPRTFLRRLLALILCPLLRLLARGVALEAHGQNLLVVLRDLQPVRIIYRDIGGIRISPRRLRAAGIDPPDLAGDLVTDDPDVLRTKLTAAVLSTVVAELLATYGREYGVDPAPEWLTVATILRGSPETPTEREDSATMLGATLPMKAMTAMRLAAQPLEDIWTPVANPMTSL